MAATDPLTSLATFLNCQLCKTNFTDPKLLSCLHTFCLRCLVKLKGKDSRQGEIVQCPLCHEQTTIVSGHDLSTMSSNDFMGRLVDILRLKNQQESKGVFCTACRRTSDMNIVATAVTHCISCEDNLCRQCNDAHRKIKVTADHRLLELDADIDEYAELMKNRPVRCDAHPDQECSLYCCQTPICLMCALLSHKSHDSLELKEIAQRYRQKLQESEVDDVRNKLNFYQQQATALEEYAGNLESNVRQTLADINKQAIELHNLIDKGSKELQDIVNYFHLDQMKNLENAKEKIKSKTSQLANIVEFSRQLRDKGSPAELCRMTDGLIAKAGELKAGEDIELIEPSKIKFISNFDISEMFRRTSNTFGTISVDISVNQPCLAKRERSVDVDPTAVKCENTTGLQHKATTTKQEAAQSNCPYDSTRNAAVADTTTKHSRYSVAPRLIKFLSDSSSARGIAVLGDSLYVVFQKSKTVDVYDRKTFSKKQSLPVTGLEDAADLAACPINQCLYLCETTRSSAFRLRISDVTILAANRFSNAPRALSVSALTGNVIVSFMYAKCLIEYTTDWKQVRKVSTTDFSPHHAVQLTDDQFVICGTSATNKGKQVVAKFTACQSPTDSSTFYANNSKLYDGSQHGLVLKKLTHVALDNEQNIFVVDGHSHMTFILDSELNKLFKSFSSQQRIKGLNKVCLNSENDAMYVGISNNVENVSVRAYRITCK